MKIAIVLEALTGSFITDMDKAGREAKKQAEKMRREWESAGRAVGLAVAGGVASLALLTKQAINTADQMAKMSQKVGVSVETLSTLKYAADQSGVSIETLQSSLVKLTKNAADASNGTGEAIRGFKALGISVLDAAGNLKSSDALLLEVAERFSEFEDGATKTAIAVNLFGRSGAELVPLLNAGANGIANLQSRARGLGLEISTNTAKQAEQFNDLLADAANMVKGVGLSIATELLPYLNEFAQKIDSPEFRDGFAAIASGAVTAATKVAELLAELGNLTRWMGEEVAATIHGIADDDIVRIEQRLEKLYAGRGTISHSLFGFEDEIVELEAQLKLAKKAQEDAAAAAAAHANELERQAKAANSAGSAPVFGGLDPAAAAAAAKAARDAAEAARRQAEAFAAANRELDIWAASLLPEAERAVAEYNIRVTDLVEDHKAGKLTADQLARALELLGTEYQRNALEIEKNARAQEIQRDVLSQVRNEYSRQIALAGLSEQQRQVEIASLQAIAQWEREHGVAIDATTEAMLRQAVQGGEAMLEAARESQRAAEQSKLAWEDFTGSLADAVIDGSSGVKRWWKAMIDDMKRQLIQSGLLKIFGSIFNIGGAQAGSGFGSMFAAMLGGGAQAGRAASMGGVGFGQLLQLAGGGGTGGSLLTSLAGAISGGISTGLMSLGGGLAGLGMGGLGGGLAWAGGSIASSGLIGGLGSSFMTGMGNLFGAGGGALMGIGQMIPAIAAIAGVAAAIQKLSGGKLFGTGYQFDSAGRQIDFTGAGVGGQDSLTEVRQRSLFRGRKWRTTNTALDAEIVGPLEEFWNAILDSNTEIARTFGRDAAIDVPASFKQAFDSAGKVTSEIGTILGRQYAETWEVFAQRITAENIIANIDGMLGTLVSAPIFGGGGGGPPGRGGDSTIVAGLGGAIPMDVQGQVGEASAIAERWRDSAEALLDGAQFLLLAATDIHTGTGLLGEGGTLTQITDLIEDLQGSGESLSATYARVAGSAALLDQALALSGVQIDGTREHIVRLATAITDAAGGLETATALWNSYFANFYSAGEMAAYTAEQLRTAAESAFSGAGLDLSDYLGDGGMDQFRAAFEAAMPTMSPEDIAAWLRAADALAAVTASARQIDAALADNAWQLYLDGLSETERATAELTRYYDDLRDSLISNAATAAQLAEVEEQRATAMGMLLAAQAEQVAGMLDDARFEDALAGMSDYEANLAKLNRQWGDSIASMIELGASEEELAEMRGLQANAVSRLAEAEQERLAAALESYEALVGGLRDELSAAGMSDFAIAMRDIDRWTRATTASLNDAARAAGLQAAREEDLALVHQVAAQRAAAAIAALQAQAEALAADLYGTPLSRLDDQIAALQEAESAASSAIGGFSGALSDAANAAAEAMGLLLGSYSPLRAVDKLPIAMDALRRGETDANTVLGIAQKVYGSGRAYNDIFYEVQRIAAQNAANASQGGGGNTVVVGEDSVSREMQALIAERDALLAEQQAAQRFMQASNLAQMVADLSTARGEGFDVIAESLGFTLEQFAEDLRFEGLDDLTEYLTALQAEQLGFAELFDTPTAGDLEIVDAITALSDAIHVPEADDTAAQERAETLTTLRDVRDALRVIAERGVNANEDAATATERVAEGVERLAVILESDGGAADAANRRRGG